MLAAWYGKVSMVKFLVELGADTTTKDNLLNTVMEYANKCERVDKKAQLVHYLKRS